MRLAVQMPPSGKAEEVRLQRQQAPHHLQQKKEVPGRQQH